MSNANTLKLGDWNAQCDICDFKYKASELRESGDLSKKGLMVCKDCYDPLHMQDLLRGRADNPSVPWARPDTSNDTTADLRGDVNYTVLSTDKRIQIWNEETTAPRAATVSVDGTFKKGDVMTIYRTGDGATNFTVQNGPPNWVVLKLFPVGVKGFVRITHNGTDWGLTNYTTL